MFVVFQESFSILSVLSVQQARGLCVIMEKASVLFISAGELFMPQSTNVAEESSFSVEGKCVRHS